MSCFSSCCHELRVFGVWPAQENCTTYPNWIAVLHPSPEACRARQNAPALLRYGHYREMVNKMAFLSSSGPETVFRGPMVAQVGPWAPFFVRFPAFLTGLPGRPPRGPIRNTAARYGSSSSHREICKLLGRERSKQCISDPPNTRYLKSIQ
jgi:hypothetical protein